MAPVIPSSINNVSLIPQTAFITRKNNCLTRSRLLERSAKQTLSSQRFLLPLSTSVRLFSQYNRGCEVHRRSKFLVLSATGTDIAVEEADTPIVKEDDAGDSGLTSNSVEISEESSIKSNDSPAGVKTKRSRPAWKSEMPPVKNEELIAGATFTGKVKSIQPFGAFVDFGAFTDGLVHVSQLSDSFVKDVGSIVSVGQEVKVRLVEANTETGRISLTMRESNDSSKLQQQKDGPPRSDKGRSPRKNTSKSNQKPTKFVKGQDLEGTVKNLARSGAFITLPEGEEGFLPSSEETDEGFASLMGGSSLQIGQEISVRVLRIARGQVTLTMKKEEANAELDAQLNQGVVHVATNPFLLAFRQNKDISAFLDAKEIEEAAKDPVIPKSSEEISEVQEKTTETTEDLVSAPSAAVDFVKDSGTSAVQENVGASEVEDTLNKDPESSVSTSSKSIDAAVNNSEEEADTSTDTLAPEGTLSTETQKIEESQAKDVMDNDAESDSSAEVKASQADDSIAKDVDVGSISGENEGITSSSEETDVPFPEESTAEGNQFSAEVVENQVDNNILKDEEQTQTSAAEKDTSTTTIENENAGPVPEKNGSVASSTTGVYLTNMGALAS